MVIGCSCYTCLPRTAPAAAQTGRKTAAPGTGTGAPQMDQRLLTNTWPKQCTKISIQQTLIKTKKQYINTIKQQEKLSLNCSTRYNDRVDIKYA